MEAELAIKKIFDEWIPKKLSLADAFLKDMVAERAGFNQCITQLKAKLKEAR
jgi:hypothetical protein